MKILKIRAMAIVLDMPMAKDGNWNSVFPATVMATFIPRYLPSLAIRKRYVTGWLESYMTQEQVGDVFEQIYGQHYSKSSISRMVDIVRTQVNA